MTVLSCVKRKKTMQCVVQANRVGSTASVPGAVPPS